MAFDEFLNHTIATLEATPVDLGRFPAYAVPGSLHTGATGIAYFLFEAARLLERADLVPLGRAWLDVVWAHATARGGLVSGGIGICYVDVLAALCEGRPVDVTPFANLDTDEVELFRGAAGIACAADQLHRRIPEPDAGSRGLLARVRDRMVERVLAARSQPLAPGPKDLLGMAHGLAGELWALVVTLGARHEVVHARLEELAELRMADPDDLVFWPPSLEAEPEQGNFGSWCNGMAGHTMLWCDVARQLPEALELARDAALTTRALEAEDPSLCCGLAGQALALHRYAALAGDAELARVADERLAAAIDRTGAELALWSGTTGVAMVALLRTRGLATWPCLETP